WVWRRQASRVHRDGHRPLELADGPRPALRRVSGRICGDNSAHHPDPPLERGRALWPVPGRRDADHSVYAAAMNARDLLPVDRIQDLTTFQGIWGRTWGFGDIELESAGRDSAEVLSMVPRPQQLRNAIFSQIEARRRPG